MRKARSKNRSGWKSRDNFTIPRQSSRGIIQLESLTSFRDSDLQIPPDRAFSKLLSPRLATPPLEQQSTEIETKIFQYPDMKIAT